MCNQDELRLCFRCCPFHQGGSQRGAVGEMAEEKQEIKKVLLVLDLVAGAVVLAGLAIKKLMGRIIEDQHALAELSVVSALH